jgi:hypothetical protein
VLAIYTTFSLGLFTTEFLTKLYTSFTSEIYIASLVVDAKNNLSLYFSSSITLTQVLVKSTKLLDVS